MKKKWWVIAAVVVVVACVGFVVLGVVGRLSAAQPVSELAGEDTAVVTRGTIRVTIDGNGGVAADEEVALSFSSGGKVAEVLVEAGDVVQSGDVLARLDDANVRQSVAEAELQVAQSELSLALARVEADAGLAQANLEAAQAAYEKTVAISQRSGDQTTSARVNLEQARGDLADAQESYDAAWDPARDWELEVDRLRPRLESEREATQKGLERAQYGLEIAQANYNLSVAGISDSDVQNAWAKVINAQISLESQSLRLDQQELSLEQAKLRLESARRTLEDMTLLAPMDGTITMLNVKAGEMAGGGQPAMTLSVLEPLVVEINLDETDVGLVSIGQAAIVTLDAFSDGELTGEVVHVAPVARITSGVVLYPVTVQLSPTELPIRVGMTADVEIVSASKTDALIVPLRAIQSEDGKSFVWLQSSSGFEEVEVTLGVITETEVEITQGLSEGDVVSVVASPASSAGQNGFRPGFLLGGGN